MQGKWLSRSLTSACLLFVFVTITAAPSLAAKVKSFSINGSIVGLTAHNATGFIEIERDVDETGAVEVYLSSPAPLDYSCGPCVVPAGEVTTTVTLSSRTAEDTSADVLARTLYDDGKTSPVTISGLHISLSISPGSIVGGSVERATGTVTITNGPPSEDIGIYLSSSSIPVLMPNVTVPANSSSGDFEIQAYPVGESQTGQITATFGIDESYGNVSSASMTVLPFTVTVTTNQSSIRAGERGTGTVRLDPRPDGAAIVTLTDSHPEAVSADSRVGIAAGDSSGTFEFMAWYPQLPVVDTITADYAGATAATNVNVLPREEPYMPCPECEGIASNPINLVNGNVWIEHTDYALPGLGGGLSLHRTWNSLWRQNNTTVPMAGMFGDSWRSTYEERLVVLSTDSIQYVRSNGDRWWFKWDEGNNRYNVLAPQKEHATLTFSTTTHLFTLTNSDGTQHIFNDTGYLSALKDRNGNQVQVTYDGSNRITQVTDAASRSITFTYGDPTWTDFVTSVQDATGTIATYSYDANGWLSGVTYADGSQLNFSYVGYGLIGTVSDSQGVTLESHTYDGNSKGLSSSRANGVEAVTISYPSDGAAQLTDSLGNTTNYGSEYAGPIRMVAFVTGPTCSSCGAGKSVAYTHDQDGNRTSSTDAAGSVTDYTYDSAGNALTRTAHLADGTNPTWSYTYNSFGQVLTATDPLGHVTTNTYDTHGNLLTTTTPPPNGSTTASTTTFTYNTNGTLHTIQDPLGHTSTLDYYSTGLIHTVTDSNNKVTTYAYDARGNRTSVIDPVNGSSKPTTFVYDSMNRLTQINYPTSPASNVQFHYDYRGRRDWVQDQNGKKSYYAYDDADRLTSVTDAQSPTPGVTQYAYDTENNLTGITDASSHQTTFSYDAQRRLSQTTFPSSLVESYGYDDNGNLTSKTDRKSNTIYYAYDALNHLTLKTYPDSTTVAYTYDLAGRLTQVVDPTGTYTFSYDNMNRLTQAGANYAFDTAGNLTVGYGYDAASNRTSMTDPQSGGTSYGYDVLNRLTSLQNPQSQSFGFGYDDLSRRSSLTRPNGINSSYSYDEVSRLLSVLHKLGTTTKDGATYVYDAAGNRTSRTDNRTGTTLTYTYDNIYQLKTAKQGTTTKETYTYDAVGNRLSSLGVSPYSYNTSNELTSTPSATYTYDNNGNTLTKTDSTGTTSYTWDYENRLTQVTLPGTGGTVAFKYDPFGRRVQKAFTQGSTTTTTNFVYDGANVLEEVNNAGTVAARYTQTLGIDEPVVEKRGSTSTYYQADGLGSVTSLSNTSGALANTYTYDSFGKLTASSGTVVNPFRYTGREFDGETGVYEYRARYYDQSIGRFASEDPSGFRGGINHYSYVKNNPANRTDPTGLAPSSPNYQACFCMRTFAFPLGSACQYECVCEPIGLPIVWIPVAELQATCGLATSKMCPWRLCPRFAIVEREIEGPYGLSPYNLLSCVQ